MANVAVTITLDRYTELVSLETRVAMVLDFAISHEYVNRDEIVEMLGGEPAVIRLEKADKERERKFKTWLSDSISSAMEKSEEQNEK